uniref:Vacuolar protein-sorting-associated protein 36 n=1 Tax=Strigamia maritima TaxID=126957 RepID=T1JJG0_STRMM
MDRFQWANTEPVEGEEFIRQQNGVRIYDGDNKTQFDCGELTLTSHYLKWTSSTDSRSVALHLSLTVFVEEERAGLGRSPKIVVHLAYPPATKPPGPVQHSPFSFVKLSFREGGATEFYRCFTEELGRRRWIHVPNLAQPVKRQVRAGIVGIERKLQEKQKETDHNISKAFEDLSKLIDMAQKMVFLAKTISTKIKEKQGDISEDETIRFKSYLLSLGIDDPVTRNSHGSDDIYHRELAKELSLVLEQPIKDAGGMLALTDVYCRVNRARGLELISPEDLLHACHMLDRLALPIRLREFDSGVMVLQLHSHNEVKLVKEVRQLLEEKESLTAEELAQVIGVSVVLAKE